MKIRWSGLALECVDEIVGVIAADDRLAARRWLTELREKVDHLSAYPESGPLMPDFAERGVRALIYGSYRIFYRVDTGSSS